MSTYTAEPIVRTPEAAPAAETRGRAILVVDDSRAQRHILASSLQRWGYEVVEAASGEEAQAILGSREIEIVLSDWMMPGMDGPELCQVFRRLKRDHYGYFILLTSKSGKEDVARGLDVGADDFLSKPVSPNELRARLAAGERILAMAQELVEKNALLSSALGKLQAVHDSLNRDLLEARRLQQALVPERYQRFGTGQMSLLMRTSGHVGGDLVGQFRINEHKLAVYSIDVSGHGVASALMTARLASCLSGASPAQNVAVVQDEFGIFNMRAPHEVCAALNDTLLRDIETDLYFTMCLAEIDLRSGRVRFAQAGHPSPAVLRASGVVEFPAGSGLPIGLIPGATYETRDLRLGPGDRLLIFSDGVTEAPNADGHFLEEDGLTEIMLQSRQLRGPAFLDELVARIEKRLPDGQFPDDVSAVLFEYEGHG